MTRSATGLNLARDAVDVQHSRRVRLEIIAIEFDLEMRESVSSNPAG